MNTIRTLIAASFLCAGSAFADGPTEAPEWNTTTSTTTREQVRAETRLAAERGQIARNEADTQRLAMAEGVSVKTRDQVRAEAVEARRLGLIASGEAVTPAPTESQLASVRLAGVRTLSVTVAQQR